MPLKQSGSESAQSENISRLVHEGYPQKQAVAISYDIKRKNDMSDMYADIAARADALVKRFDTFMTRRRLRQDEARRKMADARIAKGKKRLDDFAEAHHPRNANGVFITGEGEEGTEDTQLDPGSLSKRNIETQ